MQLEIDDDRYEGAPGSLVHIPSGVPHRNWNASRELVRYLAISAPAPDPSIPFATSAENSSERTSS
jgi:uncharacterized RmlC-like cupin family protein